MVEDLLNNKLLKAVSKEYYMELRQGILQYDGVSTSELLEHIFTNYAKIDDTLLIKNKRDSEEPPELSRPIDVYFKKQEECQRLAADGEIPTSEAEMVMKMQTHLGATGLINTKYLAWKEKAAVEHKWAPAKKYFRAVISNVEDLNNLTTDEAGLIVNVVVADKNTEQKFCEEMAEKLESPLTPYTIESLIKTINELTRNNSELTATIKNLKNHLERALGNNRRSENTDARNINGGKWPSWCALDAYCLTCGYKLRKGHDSGNCNREKVNPDHKKEATQQDTMVSSKMNAGFGNAPNGK